MAIQLRPVIWLLYGSCLQSGLYAISPVIPLANCIPIISVSQFFCPISFAVLKDAKSTSSKIFSPFSISRTSQLTLPAKQSLKLFDSQILII